MWVCACECKHPPIAEESDPSGVGLRGGCKPPDVDAGNQIWVLCMSSRYFPPLSHLSSSKTFEEHCGNLETGMQAAVSRGVYCILFEPSSHQDYHSGTCAVFFCSSLGLKLSMTSSKEGNDHWLSCLCVTAHKSPTSYRTIPFPCEQNNPVKSVAENNMVCFRWLCRLERHQVSVAALVRLPVLGETGGVHRGSPSLSGTALPRQ